MKYLVMECHTAYAVVLDENGKYLKVANMHYQVGQTVTDVVEINIPQPAEKRKINIRTISSLVAVACFILMFIPVLMFRNNPYASVYMKINPEVRIDVDKQDMVVAIKPINDDGKALIKDYIFENKNINTVVDELVDKAIDMEYLKDGGKVSLSLDTDDDEWIVAKTDKFNADLSGKFKKQDKMSVTVDVHKHHRHDDIPHKNDEDIDDGFESTDDEADYDNGDFENDREHVDRNEGDDGDDCGDKKEDDDNIEDEDDDQDRVPDDDSWNEDFDGDDKEHGDDGEDGGFGEEHEPIHPDKKPDEKPDDDYKPERPDDKFEGENSKPENEFKEPFPDGGHINHDKQDTEKPAESPESEQPDKRFEDEENDAVDNELKEPHFYKDMPMLQNEDADKHPESEHLNEFKTKNDIPDEKTQRIDV